MVTVKLYEENDLSIYVDEDTGRIYMSPEQLQKYFPGELQERLGEINLPIFLESNVQAAEIADGERAVKVLYTEEAIFKIFSRLEPEAAKLFIAYGTRIFLRESVGCVLPLRPVDDSKSNDSPDVQKITTRLHWCNDSLASVYIQDSTGKPFVTIHEIFIIFHEACFRDDGTAKLMHESCDTAPVVECAANNQYLYSGETVYDIAIAVDPAIAKEMALVGVDQWLYNRVDYNPSKSKVDDANKVPEITYRDNDKSFTLSEDDFEAAMKKAREARRGI